MTAEQLEVAYPDWITLSGREKAMDEYGNLISIIGYVSHCAAKKHLLLIVEER